MNQLYYGDNLNVLRDRTRFPDEFVDLIYLDPPFNSKRDYNLLFKSPKGQESEAQIEAFKDSWFWGDQAERELDDLIQRATSDIALVMNAFVSFLGRNDMMAYLVMMTNRLLEMHRVLKPTGSLYLHCDPSASHYLKIVLDAVFGKENFKNEIIWKRTSAHSGSKRWGPVHDSILFVSKSNEYVWNNVFQTYDDEYVESFYRYNDAKGRFRVGDLTGAGTRKGESGQDWRGINPTHNGRHWAVPNKILLDRFGETSSTWSVQEKLDVLDKEGLIFWPAKGKMPGFKRYLNLAAGVSIVDVITDVDVIGAQAQERLGYPTQKPLALLERIVSASSTEGGVVLDPFCGCGTAVHAAQRLKRKWIGIDITCLAISLIEKRLKDAFGARCKFEVQGTPKDLESARDLAVRDKYQFQWWAVSLVGAKPFQGKKKGADTGIDGLKFFYDLEGGAKKIVISVKGGTLKPDDIRALNHVREREKAEIGILVSLHEPTPKMRADAASAGIYAGGKKQFPRVQLLTIEGLLSGKERAEHPDYVPDVNFKKAKREPEEASEDDLFE